MIETTVQFKGLSEIDDAMKQLPLQMQKSVLRAGLKLAATALRDSMARRAARSAVHRVRRLGRDYPKHLADAIAFRIRFRNDGDPTAEVGPSKIAFWGLFVELGTRFQPARPFMRPALDEDGQIVVSAFANGARDQLETVARRLRRS